MDLALGHKPEPPEFINGHVLDKAEETSRFVYAVFAQIKPLKKRSVLKDNVFLKRVPTWWKTPLLTGNQNH